MAKTELTPANELERRKQLRIRIRADLGIEAQRYEGRTYYVVKDPVSMRYYRLKDHEYFLVRYMDGKNTLDDAQKAYEMRYRPDRLKLEELEGFAQQLLTAGLAHNESPKSGKQLYDRRKKRLRSEWMQTLTNILYIKIPVFDPDRLLTRMVKYFRFIFTMPFFLLSVGVMVAALMLVGTHFEMFRSKLPNYHEFFSFKSVAYLWVALGCVKVIHEFGHGLSCKRFGGEVHEMGALLLCFSPALYCNVSDAWTLPNKWHRIIISAAGIYVELIIAAVATFVWWHSADHPFVNNMSLSLMVVCSVSTVVFNANPLMRYDGYYVLADWLEIPNLRERSNRYLTNLFLEHCLGVEVPPEEYMALWRRILFVVFAVVSYVYRWVITFTVLFFFNNFLKPYKLEIVGQLLTFASLGSMLGWPLYRLGKNIHRRGRLPDMKRWRVVVTSCVVAALIGFICFVPLPIGRIRTHGVLETPPENQRKVFVNYPGKLERLFISGGQYVREGDELAIFSNPQLETDIREAASEMKFLEDAKVGLEQSRKLYQDQSDQKRVNEIEKQLIDTREKLRNDATRKHAFLTNIKTERLVLRAPTSGIIGVAPDANDIGKTYEVNEEQRSPFCTIIEPRKMRVCLPVSPSELNRLREQIEQPTDDAVKTIRRLREDKVTLHVQNQPLDELLNDLEKQAHGLHFQIDPASDLSPELRVSYAAEGQVLANALDQLFSKIGVGYIVVSDANRKENGSILVRPGRERVFPEGPRVLAQASISIRLQGRGSETWQGQITSLPESETKEIPLQLSNRGGGPVTVKPERSKSGGLIPQTQYFLVYVDIVNADDAMAPGTSAQVKISCKPETCLKWVWRTINTSLELRLM
jgi:putative peptide zinc metalloprotease protein